MNDKELMKQEAAEAAAEYIKEGMTIGLGTGTTAYYLIRKVGAMVSEGMKLRGVATSMATEELAFSCGIPVVRPEEVDRIHLAVDGVDEIDNSFCAVKGGGGALLREKLIASKADDVIWIMDESKLVQRLGMFPFPVEVVPFGYPWVVEALLKMGGRARLRMQGNDPYNTDNGNYILDIVFPDTTDYREAAMKASQIPGIVETGYFEALCSRIIVGTKDGVRQVLNPKRTAGKL